MAGDENAAVPLNLGRLKALVGGGAVAIRGRATLEPAGGPGDKVFPPTHSVDKFEKKPGAKYACELRRVWDDAKQEWRSADCVLLDSVQSQANRMEEALQELWTAKKIHLPVIEVDLAKVMPEVGKVTSLTAPHRIADAILRDSLLRGTFFRLSDLGKSFTNATPRNALPLFKVCPTALIFGMWDSTGPLGGMGSKFARVLVSEIVGIGFTLGVRTESRIDPVGIMRDSGVLYIKKAAPEEPLTWTLEPSEAREEVVVAGGPKEPLKWGSKLRDGKWKQGDGTPGTANHGNIPPGFETLAGGGTIESAVHTVVVSLAGLRKLSFDHKDRDVDIRVALAALALLAVMADEARGHDLRSRCLLVPKAGSGLALEAVGPTGETEAVTLKLESAQQLYLDAMQALPETAFEKEARSPGQALATLTPSPKLAALITTSRELAARGEAVEDE